MSEFMSKITLINVQVSNLNFRALKLKILLPGSLILPRDPPQGRKEGEGVFGIANAIFMLNLLHQVAGFWSRCPASSEKVSASETSDR